MGDSHQPVRCAIVPPAPAPYREPLFAALHAREDLDVRVIYQSASQPSWDMPAQWFAAEHAYPAAHLRSWQLGRPGRTPVIWPRGLERALRAADPDCVVVSEYGAASLRALAWCRRRGRAFVVFTECTPHIDAILTPPQLRLHRWVAGRADAVIAVSSAARERLLRFGVAEERIRVALQSADLEPFRAAAAVRGDRAEGQLVVLSVGRLVPDKNFASLIEAFARTESAETRLEIVGAGFLQAELERLSQGLGVAVRFRGAAAPAELPRIYAEADIYALVSTYEPFGVSIREAAAAGLPILCTRFAGAAGDVAVQGANALLVDPTDVEAMSAALKRLIEDRALRARMAVQSRAIDAETSGHEAGAFAAAVIAAARRRGR